MVGSGPLNSENVAGLPESTWTESCPGRRTGGAVPGRGSPYALGGAGRQADQRP